MSIIFNWEERDFNDLVASCEQSETTDYILKYMAKDGKILEAGCGLGRYVVYLSQLGYDIEGIELGQEAVNILNKIKPDLTIKQGDVSQLPYENDSISGIISLGVVEHFIEGPEKPLLEMKRVIKPEHYIVITVPSLNYIRQIKHICGYEKLKKVNFIRQLSGLKPVNKINTKNPYKYITNDGKFFEYRFTKKEFETEIIDAGLTIIESVPVEHLEGLYHEFGKILVLWKNKKFQPNILGNIINLCFSKKAFFHNHMHLCICKK